MKKLGIIGGVSPVSTALYYTQINRKVNQRLGNNNSAEMLVYSVNFEELVQLKDNNLWDEAGAYLADKAETLNKANVDVAILACNTLHRCASALVEALDCPFIHIGDATGQVIARDQRESPLLIGTLPTTTESFISERLGPNVRIPDEYQRRELDRIVFEELCRDIVDEKSRQWMIEMIEQYAMEGADCVVLGCTEFGLLIDEHNVTLPAYDTAEIHINAAVDFILS